MTQEDNNLLILSEYIAVLKEKICNVQSELPFLESKSDAFMPAKC
jgi:hypothetical protein